MTVAIQNPGQGSNIPQSTSFTAAETARMLKALGLNWLDVEFVLELAPHKPLGGHMHYSKEVLEKFVGRAFWLPETPPLEAVKSEMSPAHLPAAA